MRLAAHILFPIWLPAAVLLGVAALSLAPRGLDAAHLAAIEDDPAALADYAVEKTLTPDVARREIENALAADDADLAASFVALARERGVAIDPALAGKVEAASAPSASAVRSAKSFFHGLVTGAPDDLAGLAGTATGDLFVFGDIRDAVRESNHILRGEPVDRFILGLACAGIAVTGATYATLGGGLPERMGLTLVKSLGKTRRLTRPMTEWITRSARETVDTAALGAAVTKASFTAPEMALRAARDAVKLDRAQGLVTVARDVSKVQAKAGTKAALEGVRVAEGPKDVRRLARLAEAKGGKTRAILKLAGRGAFALTVALFDLIWWICMAAGSLLGFTLTVKRITDRATLRYLRWRKARHARAALAAAAPA